MQDYQGMKSHSAQYHSPLGADMGAGSRQVAHRFPRHSAQSHMQVLQVVGTEPLEEAQVDTLVAVQVFGIVELAAVRIELVGSEEHTVQGLPPHSAAALEVCTEPLEEAQVGTADRLTVLEATRLESLGVYE